MTNDTNRPRNPSTTWWFAGGIILIVACTFLSFRWTRQNYDDARFQARELEGCHEIASSINKAKSGPRRAEESEIDHSQLNQAIERIVVAGGIQSGQLRRIEPAHARRLGDSSYLTKPTEIHLNRVTLNQAVIFLRNLVAEQEGLHVDELRLQAPHGEEVGSLWILDATVSYLIYDPITQE